jgi:3-oxoacyl-[acyl-carrier-protein] synthase-3
MSKARIAAIEAHLPERVLTNEQLGAENPDWRMDDLEQKLGVVERRIAAEGETASDLAFEACRKLLDRTSAADIDYLLYCTQSPDYYMPSSACILQDRLGLQREIGAFDFNLGCSGYVYGLHMAKCLIAAGEAQKILLVTADTYSKYIHPNDRTVRVLFGDGATATLIESADDGPGELGPFLLRTDGRGRENLIVPAGGLRLPKSPDTAREATDESGCCRSKNNLFMDGPAIFSFAISSVPRLVREILAKAGLTSDQIDFYVYHQANKFMLDQLFQRSKIPESKALRCYRWVGNTVSSSIPLAVEQGLREGIIETGHRLLLVGFGVGYSWGAGVLTWG